MDGQCYMDLILLLANCIAYDIKEFRVVYHVVYSGVKIFMYIMTSSS